MAKKKKQLRHTVGGYHIFLKPVERGPLLMVLSESDKPPAPRVEVTYAGGVKGTEVNRNDPKYKNDMEMWEAQYNSRIFRTCIVRGIDHVEKPLGTIVGPSDDAIEDIRFIYGDVSPNIAYRYWCAEIIGNTSKGFMNLVLGQTNITGEGLQKDEDRFRPTREESGIRRSDNEVPVSEDDEDTGEVSE